MSLAANTNQLINGSLLTIHQGTYIVRTSVAKPPHSGLETQSGGHMRRILTVPMFVFKSGMGVVS